MIRKRRYGRLKVLELAEVRNQTRFYSCACDCGRLRTFSASSLYTGASTSCGFCGLKLVNNKFSIDSVKRVFEYKVMDYSNLDIAKCMKISETQVKKYIDIILNNKSACAELVESYPQHSDNSFYRWMLYRNRVKKKISRRNSKFSSS